MLLVMFSRVSCQKWKPVYVTVVPLTVNATGRIELEGFLSLTVMS